MQDKPTLFISNFHPFISRNIFDSGVLSKLSERAAHVYVFVLKHKEEYLRKRYEGGNVSIIGIDLREIAGSRFETKMRYVAELLLNTKTKQLHQKLYLNKTRKIGQ